MIMFKGEEIQSVYLIGIGGIGMSALARYFLNAGLPVGGYDRTTTRLTDELTREGCDIHFMEDINLIGNTFKDARNTLVIYTPAVPPVHRELVFFRQQGFRVWKRSEVLGIITGDSPTVAVAGTHGKTTVSAMLAHILHRAGTSCNAFIGGIMKNYGSNVLFSVKSELTVVEADEFDRSFLQLSPLIGVVTSCDPDHLDVYKNYSALASAFNSFAAKIKPEGSLLLNAGVSEMIRPPSGVKTYTYSLDRHTDFYACNIRVNGKDQSFDLVLPDNRLRDLVLGIPGTVNIENAVAATAAAWILGTDLSAIAPALGSYQGVRRRFDIQVATPDQVYIDDYAHHPEEIKAFIRSVREMLPGKRITGIFQPHLYSRTRDFAKGFAESLSNLDELILLDIYPAREDPLPGVTSSLIFDKVLLKDKRLCSMDQLPGILSEHHREVVLTMGAGNIDQMVEQLKNMLTGGREVDE